MFSTLILDDEVLARNTLCSLLQQYCSQLQPVFFAGNVSSAAGVCRDNQIDILFLDVNMGKETGFDLLRQIPYGDKAVIFVTAYEEYGLKALKTQAVDYLLKPIAIDELVQAVEKAKNLLNRRAAVQGPVPRDVMAQQIVISHHQGFELFDLSDIIFAAAEGNYTAFHLEGDRKILSSKQLCFYEHALAGPAFFRAHRSYIVNLRHLKSFSSKDGYTALLSGNHEVPVSRRRLSEFLGRYKK